MWRECSGGPWSPCYFEHDKVFSVVWFIDYPGLNIRSAHMLFDGELSQKASADIDARPAIMSSDAISLKDCQKCSPDAIVYKTHPLTYVMGKMLVNAKHFGTANILLKRCMWLELIQSQMKPNDSAKYISRYIDDEKLQHPLRKVSKELEKTLSAGKDMSVAPWSLAAIE